MRTLNLGILAHVDAGKTTLTERLLFTAGAIDRIGSVDAGTTQTDSLELERERGITIRSAVASFLVDDLAVNLVDTPGHPDFIAEVERVLGILDGAVLVVSAVEGVQPQTPLLFRALQRLHVPTLIFVNKIDRPGADAQRVLEAMARRLSPAVVPMGTVRDAGHREAAFVPFGPDDEVGRVALAEVLAERDDSILRAFVGDETALSPARLREQLGAQIRLGWVYPVYFGSAAMGAGIDELLAGVDGLLSGARGDPEAEVSGRVFKIERASGGERVAYVRLFAGTLRPRQRVRVGGGEEVKPTSIRLFAPAASPRRDAAGRRRDGDGPRTRRGSGRRRDRRATSGPGGRPLASCVRRWRRSCSRSAPSRRAASARPSHSSRSRTRSSTSARTTTDTRSRSRSTAMCRRKSSRPPSSATTASPPTSARRRSYASSARPASAKPRRSSARRPRRTSPAGAHR